MRTAVVILNWNTKDYLERFLPGLLASATEGTEVIIADSASTDGSLEMLSDKFPSVRQIRLDRNYGFTGGYNRAFKAVCGLPEAVDLEYFVLINSDIEVPKDWLRPLTSWMDSHPDCAACAPKLHSWYNKDSFEYAGAAGGMIDCLGYPFCRGRVLKIVEKDTGQYDSPAKVFWATGACLMVRKTEYSKIGGLDDRFFAHMEEIDLCWRLQLEGKSIFIVPESVVWHLGGGYCNNLLMLQNNLAKTYSLQEIRELTPEKAAAKACRRARGTIFLRKCLDGCSALVYLLTGKKEFFKAVLEAHRDFRRLEAEPDVNAVQEYAGTHRRIDVPALFPEWIVPLAMLKGKGIFEYLRKFEQNNSTA